MKKIVLMIIIIIIIAFNISPCFAFTWDNGKTQFYDVIEEYDYQFEDNCRAYYYNDGYNDCFFYVDLDTAGYFEAEVMPIYLCEIQFLNSFYGRYNDNTEHILLPESAMGYILPTYLNSTKDKNVYIGVNNMYIWKEVNPSIKAGTPYYFSVDKLHVYNSVTQEYDEKYGSSLIAYNLNTYDININEPIIFLPPGTTIYASYKDDVGPTESENLIMGNTYEENFLNLNWLGYLEVAKTFFNSLYGIIPYEIYIVLASGMGLIALIAIIRTVV